MTQAITTGSRPVTKSFFNSTQIESLASLLVGTLVCGLLGYGWLYRTDTWINPEDGIGYKLGIIGGSMMLLLLL